MGENGKISQSQTVGNISKNVLLWENLMKRIGALINNTFILSINWFMGEL